jgi:hypothetical protein
MLGAALLGVVALTLTTGTKRVHADGTTSSLVAKVDADRSAARTPYAWVYPSVNNAAQIYGIATHCDAERASGYSWADLFGRTTETSTGVSVASIAATALN